MAFPGYPGIPEGWQGAEAVSPFLVQAQQESFDLAIQMHGSGSYMNPFTVLLGAKRNAGFYVPGQFCPSTQGFLPYPDSESEIWRLLRLMQFLGILPQGDELEFPIKEVEYERSQAVLEKNGLQVGRYVCLHAGANSRDRRWSVRGFAQVADQLADWGYQVVLTGTVAEQAVVQSVCQLMRTSAVNVVGQTDLGALAALLQQSQLLVCNDTGVSHLAAALKVPSVVVFSNSEVHRWAPLDRHRHRVVCHQQSVDATAAAILAHVQNSLLGDEAISPPSSQLEVSYAR